MKKFIVVLLTLFPLITYAAWTTTSGVIDIVYSHNGIIVIDTALPDNPCGKAGRFWWPTLGGDSAAMLSLSLAAHSTGRPIKVNYDSGNAECSYSGAKITHLAILK